jgi:hypothetical protein
MLDAVTIQNLLDSIDLFIRRFEFNASIYYIIRWFGTLIKGYNIIAFAGPVLAATAALVILYISIKKREICENIFFHEAVFIISTWLLFSTTVHPWYLCMPVALALFTGYRFVFVWSFTATLSYAAYQYQPVQENLWLTGTGYIFLLCFAIYEFKKPEKSLPSFTRVSL